MYSAAENNDIIIIHNIILVSAESKKKLRIAFCDILYSKIRIAWLDVSLFWIKRIFFSSQRILVQLLLLLQPIHLSGHHTGKRVVGFSKVILHVFVDKRNRTSASMSLYFDKIIACQFAPRTVWIEPEQQARAHNLIPTKLLLINKKQINNVFVSLQGWLLKSS